MMMSSSNDLSVSHLVVDERAGKKVKEYSLVNKGKNGIQVRIIDWGAVITSVLQPNRDGASEDVVLGYSTADEWISGKSWMNSLVGRHANRIKEGQFTIDGHTYQLERNNLTNHLHGGNSAFNAKWMESEEIRGSNHLGVAYVGVAMKFISPDGDDHYPGELHVETRYLLLANNSLQMEFHASVRDKPTIVNMCNHAYWNLSGRVSDAATGASSTILDHHLRVRAHHITELDGTPNMLSTGRVLSLCETPFDFRTARTIGSRLEELNKTIIAPGGYDNNYVIDHSVPSAPELAREPHLAALSLGAALPAAAFAARLEHTASGRRMDVYTTAPGVQVYTGNFLDGKAIVGRNGVAYPKHAAVCLETQAVPDSINHQAAFAKYGSPSGILRPGEKYSHVAVHVFSTQ